MTDFSNYTPITPVSLNRITFELYSELTPVVNEFGEPTEVLEERKRIVVSAEVLYSDGSIKPYRTDDLSRLITIGVLTGSNLTTIESFLDSRRTALETMLLG